MKAKYTLLVVMAGVAFTAFGQDEVDDMYFNSKDRAKQNAAQEIVLAKKYKEEDAIAKVNAPINPTDSYSGRAVNPEYVNRLKTDPNQANSEPQYYVANFQPTSVNKNLGNVNYGNSFYSPYYGNCPCNNPNSYYGYNSPFMNPYSAFNPGFGMSMYSPYYGSGFYNPYYGSPYGSSASMMLGYSFGGGAYNPWYTGLSVGMSYGMSSMYSPFWNNYYGYNSFYPSYGYGGAYPVAYDTRNSAIYQKRTSRSSELNNMVYNSGRGNSAIVDVNGRSRGAASGGRVADAGASTYYHRGWRSNPDIVSGANQGRNSFWSNSGISGNSFGRSGDSGNSWGRSGDSFGNSRSSFGNSGLGGFGGGGRAGGGGGHSSGGTRGRD